MTEKQEALKALEEKMSEWGGSIAIYSVLGQWAHDNLDIIRAALTEAPKADVAAVKRDCLSAINRFQMQEFVVADAINYVATHYDLVEKEKPND